LADDIFDAGLSHRLNRYQQFLNRSDTLNVLRRFCDALKMKIYYSVSLKNRIPLKLHLGCGNRHLEGFVNIDWRKTPATDLVGDIKKPPFPDHTVQLIEAYHVMEHLPRHEVNSALKRWRRLLMRGGTLVIECPDFDEIVRQYMAGDESQLDGIFGLQRFTGDYHLFGYNRTRIMALLEQAGFCQIREEIPQDYHAKEWPCLRFECHESNTETLMFRQESKDSNLSFAGERIVEGSTPARIWTDHIARYDFAGKYVQGKIVLDIGCGTGIGSQILKQNGARCVIGTDISQGAIAFAKNNYAGHGFCFSVGDIYQTSFPSNFFDAVVCLETIEHLRHHHRILSELRRILKPQGLLVLSSPNRVVTSPGQKPEEPPRNPFHQKEHSKQELRGLVSAYFHDVEIYGQRGVNGVIYTPFIEKILRRFLPRLYHPEYGSPLVEKQNPDLEYRYLIALCKEPKNRMSISIETNHTDAPLAEGIENSIEC
jgi:ubiquinone/menaquinone biosynthesis C-methylase UbiE